MWKLKDSSTRISNLKIDTAPLFFDFWFVTCTQEINHSSTNLWVQTQKTHFCLILPQFPRFSSLFTFFVQKNVKKAYFNQLLECAAPKCWPKYTTPDIWIQRTTRSHRCPNCFDIWMVEASLNGKCLKFQPESEYQFISSNFRWLLLPLSQLTIQILQTLFQFSVDCSKLFWKIHKSHGLTRRNVQELNGLLAILTDAKLF